MTGPATLYPLHILLVENHADTRGLLKLYLESLGHCVRAVATKAEGLREASIGGCNVLISDIGLADGNGWELLEQAKFPKTGLRHRDERLRDAGRPGEEHARRISPAYSQAV